MSSDRELLELAAKAAGYEVSLTLGGGGWINNASRIWPKWNPLTDDGDALRLAVKLELKVRWHATLNQALVWPRLRKEISVNGEDVGNDQFAATRLAIVRAAAEIGRAMP